MCCVKTLPSVSLHSSINFKVSFSVSFVPPRIPTGNAQQVSSGWYGNQDGGQREVKPRLMKKTRISFYPPDRVRRTTDRLPGEKVWGLNPQINWALKDSCIRMRLWTRPTSLSHFPGIETHLTLRLSSCYGFIFSHSVKIKEETQLNKSVVKEEGKWVKICEDRGTDSPFTDAHSGPKPPVNWS